MMTPREDASNVLGWMSIAIWIVVFSPQLIENYQLQSGEGLSVLFIVIWLLGDICNFVGASMAGLLPTVIILALYYVLCDTGLLFQIYYYRWKDPSLLSKEGKVQPANDDPPTETTPLIQPSNSQTTGNKPQPPSKLRSLLASPVFSYTLAVLFVLSTGFIAWTVDQRDTGSEEPPKKPEVVELKSQILGWTSAALYIGSRIPQIRKNVETKCEGLSLAMFVFAMAGNLTYVLSICVISTSKEHLIANASWLAGSGSTISLDLYVMYQFYRYREAREKMRRETTGQP